MTRLSLTQAREFGIIPKNKQKNAAVKKSKSAATWDVELVLSGVVFTIPENMPSLNEWKNWHWSKQAEYKQFLTDALSILALKAGKPKYEKAKIKVVHCFRVNRRRDEDNLTPKFLLDALRYAGVIAEDHAEVLQLMPPIIEVDSVRWRTEIYIVESKE
ncbi:MAG: hypothetical protein SCK28_01540 [Bacillota bacterium]|nr:hypothetical protein [Bacillota bacterium]